MKYIKSNHNPHIKHWVSLRSKASTRKLKKLFLVEGKREVYLALKGNYQLDKLLICEGFESQHDDILRKFIPSTIILSKEIYKKIAYRENTEGLIALMHTKKHLLDELTFSKPNPLILIAESLEKPGNIGAILRSADAANLDAVIISDPSTDLYNSNVIRSSLGAIFTLPIAVADSLSTINFLKEKKITSFASIIDEKSESYHCQDYKKACAIIVGSEKCGLDKVWHKHSDKQIVIPMSGRVDSMNVSVSAAVIIFEAIRQRNS